MSQENIISQCSHQYWDLGHCIDCYKTQNEIDAERRQPPVAPDDTPPDRFVSYAEVIQFTLERAAKIADQMAGAPWGGEHDSITPRHLAEQIAAAIRQAGTHELAAKHHHPFRGQRGEMGGGACCDCGNSFTNTCHDPILVDKPPVAPDDTPTPEQWRNAALLKDRTRRAIRERQAAGDAHHALADDYGVPLEFVQALCAWQLGGDWRNCE